MTSDELAELDWDLKRGPFCFRQAGRYARKFEAEAVSVLVRGQPGDRMRVAKRRWYARNNRRSADRWAAFLALHGVAVSAACVQGDLFSGVRDGR